ncbi:MAG: tail fiber domain-containing protein [Saprospiraceae bacterium]
MRQSIFSLFFFCAFSSLFAQSVSINTDGSTAHSSSIFEVKSTNKGMLVPRMTTAQRDAIAAPATGLLIYNTDINVFQFRNGTVWTNLNSEKILVDADGDTKIQVEELADEDVIRFDLKGNERMVLRENASGYPTLELTDPLFSTLIGKSAGEALTTGSHNTGVGHSVLSQTTTGSKNSAMGHGAMVSNTTGTDNVAVGVSAMFFNETGNSNVAIGNFTLQNSTSSAYNTALGFTAGFQRLHGLWNTFVGSYTDANADGYNNGTALGYNAEITASNQVRIGNVSVTSIGGFQNWSNISDARFKNEVRADVPGLDFIARLRPVTYTLDRNKIRHELGQEQKEDAVRVEPRSTGFLAQEVEAAAKALGFEFSGVDAPKNEQDFYGLRYAEFTVPLVKAVQELDAENKALKARLDALESLVQKR